jgi:RND family efflux transporter MFP subunit
MLAIISIILLGAWSGCSGDDPRDKQPINVVAQKVTNAVDEQSIAYNGTIEESESIPLSFSTVGNVARVLVSEGDFVKKGQLLASLNDETYKNIYEMSLASQKQAEDAYKRLLPMYKNGNLPEIKYVEVETGLQQAKSAALISKKNVDDCRLYSPVDGIVGKRSIDPGMSAIPNLTSITIVKIDKVLAKVPVSESEISSIKIGDKAKIKIAALKDPDFIGTIEEIGVMADPIAHTYKIKIGILNKSHQIKPGMICNVTINRINEAAGLFVTNSALLVDEKGRNFVYAVNGDKAFRKYVTTGKLLRNGVEITSGLNNGEQIVVTGQQKLDDNTPVRIVNR